MLARVSAAAHRSFPEIIAALPRDVVDRTVGYPGVEALLALDAPESAGIREALRAGGQHRARGKGA